VYMPRVMLAVLYVLFGGRGVVESAATLQHKLL